VFDQDERVALVEHNLDVIKLADWVIDLGPEAGMQGGRLVAMGRPEDVAAVDASYTGVWLRTVLPPVVKHRSATYRSVPELREA
jgi:excinuclease ABC subunit A